MFRQVRAEVLRDTKNEQEPWYQESLVGSFSFNTTAERPLPQPTSSPTAVAAPPPSPQPSPSPSIAAVTQPTPSPSTPPPQSGITLISKATGVNYTRLRDLLAAGKWKEADQETTRAMLQAANREEQGGWSTEDVDKFSCEDLRIIDKLWLDFSKGNFGDQVGWGKEGNWEIIVHDDLTFNLNAPEGNLPTSACNL